MKIWEYNSETKKIQEGKISLSGKTVLVLPGIETTDEKQFLINYYIAKTDNNLAGNNNNIKIYCTSWTPDPESNLKKASKTQNLSPKRIDEVIKHNQAPFDHINGMQGLVDEVFLPILKDKSRWQELDNLTIFANSYGTTALGQLENGLRKSMADLNLVKEDQKKIMNKVCAVGVLPVTNISKKISFKKVFFAPSNDRMNAGVNLEADHLSNEIDSKPYYEKINDHGLLVSAPAIPVKNVGGNLEGLPPKGSPININSGHNIISLLAEGDDLYTSPNPDLFPVLIRTVLNNAVNRDGNIDEVAVLLRPIKPKPTVSGQEGHGFTDRVKKHLITKFIQEGCNKNSECRSH